MAFENDSESKIAKSQHVDPFKDTAFRYLGYTNEIGEALRPLIKRVFVNGSYGIASVYVLADTCHKAFTNYEGQQPARNASIAAGDTLIWQTFASIIIPGYTINRLGWATSYILKKTKAAAKLGPVTRILPTIIGIASIPIIITPIDFAVDKIMDRTYRPLTGTPLHRPTPQLLESSSNAPTPRARLLD